MQKKINRSTALLVTLTLLLCLLSGCNTVTENEIIGQWYNDSGKCLDIRSDGSYKLEGSYGEGQWKLLDDKETYQFTDVYKDTQESKILTDQQGKYIDFGYYGDFYKKEIEKDETKIENAETEQVSNSSNEIAYTAVTLGDFSNGVAWMIYSATENEITSNFLALINTDGKILYQQLCEDNNNNNNNLPQNISGTSLLEADNASKVIDNTGKILLDTSLGEYDFDEILACGEDTLLVYKYSGPQNEKFLYGLRTMIPY